MRKEKKEEKREGKKGAQKREGEEEKDIEMSLVKKPSIPSCHWEQKKK